MKLICLDFYKISVTLICMNSPIKVINHTGFILNLKAAHKGQGQMKLRARNANRKQFYPEKNRVGYGGTLRKSKYQQDLPTKFATHFAFYGNYTVLMAVANIYKSFGVNVFVVPTK